MDDTSARRLAGPVTVGNQTYYPGDDLPAEVAAQIRNPKAWASEADGGAEEAAPDTSPRRSGTASGARLAGPVTVGGQTYGPDDEIPDEVAAQIRNPKAWVGGQLPTTTAVVTPAGARSGSGAAAGPDTGGPDPATGAGTGGAGPDPDEDGAGEGAPDPDRSRRPAGKRG